MATDFLYDVEEEKRRQQTDAVNAFVTPSAKPAMEPTTADPLAAAVQARARRVAAEGETPSPVADVSVETPPPPPPAVMGVPGAPRLPMSEEGVFLVGSRMGEAPGGS